MEWVYLFLAGLFEIGWPLSMKFGWNDQGIHMGWLGVSVLCMVVSGGLLLLALRHLPMGTAYAVWTGIGAVGGFLAGSYFFGEPLSFLRSFSIVLIVMGIIGLKLA